MRVLMFGWEFPPHITGGLGTACFGLTKGLMKHGTEVIFVVPRAYGDENQEAVRLINASDFSIDTSDPEYNEYWKRITFLQIGSNLIPYVAPEEFTDIIVQQELEKQTVTKGVFSKRFEFSGKYNKDLFEEISRYALVASAVAASQDFDVIHAHDWLTYPAGMAAKSVSGKPLVVHMHATEFDRSGENVNQNIYDIEREGMETADRVITVSNLTRQIVIQRYGIDPDKVVTVHNAVEPVDKADFSDTSRGVKEKIVTFLGRLTYQKGPEYFVEAAKKVLERDSQVRFVMAGSGDMMKKMIRRVATLRMATRFHFTGFLQGQEVDRMFLMTDVFVMPSVSEPFGIVPLEAMRSNVPVVISRQSGVAEVLRHALKIDFWDVDALADSIYGLLHYEALSAMFKKYGKDEVDNLKWEDAALKVKQVYEDVMNLTP
ncbi:MAG: glycosyltransferase family 4 protein [Bacteroidetes bacterium]|nr:glycosyltransferase family 4 protein [Bacteroidota bacterium]